MNLPAFFQFVKRKRERRRKDRCMIRAIKEWIMEANSWEMRVTTDVYVEGEWVD